ncbi:mercuric transporter MerT family protein [Arcobacter sp. F2176]|uniref:mercuric transporter MerT family protein n=1 Tax=Arcobacter sp. F2176 TaxID=2044511 RepID=UPI00100BACAB|nr:mercuric transporter MerT family protein [Arcobacter sp. F2176]RXJ79963.1 transporter [Arcobacter sp. F2176]
MNKINIPIIGAVLTALLSTLCCLPAFLFLFFGISSGVLTYFTELDFLRIPMVIITFALLFFAVKRFKKKISCKCTKKQRTIHIIFTTLFFSLIFFLLLYPELIPLFMD